MTFDDISRTLEEIAPGQDNLIVDNSHSPFNELLWNSDLWNDDMRNKFFDRMYKVISMDPQRMMRVSASFGPYRSIVRGVASFEHKLMVPVQYRGLMTNKRFGIEYLKHLFSLPRRDNRHATRPQFEIVGTNFDIFPQHSMWIYSVERTIANNVDRIAGSVTSTNFGASKLSVQQWWQEQTKYSHPSEYASDFVETYNLVNAGFDLIETPFVPEQLRASFWYNPSGGIVAAAGMDELQYVGITFPFPSPDIHVAFLRLINDFPYTITEVLSLVVSENALGHEYDEEGGEAEDMEDILTPAGALSY